MRRRELLAAGALAAAGIPLSPGFERGGGAARQPRFIFVVNNGGWDPTRVFAAEFGNAHVAMERDAEPATVAGLRFVDHPGRPNVRSFMKEWGSRSLVLNGLAVPSVVHANCQGLGTVDNAPRCTAGDEEQGASGQFSGWWSALGIQPAASLSFAPGSWDTHRDNDVGQNRNFEALFVGLRALMARLATTRVSGAGSLADETVVVVLSEMGRTPHINAAAGKDHWPYTSMMMVGTNIPGGRVMGGYDPLFYGRKIDLASGEIDDHSGTELSVDVMRATLVAMAGVDGERHRPSVPRLEGILL